MARPKRKKAEEAVSLVGESYDKTSPADSEIAEKTSSIGYRGGLDCNLDRIMSSGQTLGTALSFYLKENLDREVLNQEKLVKRIQRSERQYAGRKKSKAFPWPNCSNISVPETRKNVDTVLVRLLDAIFNRRKIFIVKANKPELMEQARAVEKALDWFFKHVIHLKEKLMSPLLQGLKSGTGIMNITWESKKEAVYRYATPEEESDDSVHKYEIADSDSKVVKDVQTFYEGPQWLAVPREDFIISSDAINVKDARLVGFKSYQTLTEMRLKEKQGVYRKGATEKLTGGDRYDEVKESRAENQGKEIRPLDENTPYEVWTLWAKYDVDEDGEADNLVISFHANSGTILRCLYNPVFTGNRPFVRIVPWPTEFSFDGDGLCNALYHIQEAIDAIQNQRIDRGTLLNSYVTVSRTGIGLDNFKFSPGKHYVCEENPTEDVFRVIQVPDVSPSQFQEQSLLTALGERLSGISPAMQGISTSERPVAKETFALIEEANKKFKSMIDNIRDGLTEGAYQTLELMAQYQPTLRFKEDQDGEWVEQTVSIPVMSLREGFDIELAASTEVLSQETRREIWLNVFMLVRQFQTDVGGMAQMLTSPQVPSDMKKVIMQANQIGVEILKQILLDFEVPNAEQLVLNLGTTVDVKKCMVASPDIQAQMGPPQGGMQSGPPGGRPDQGPAPSRGIPPQGARSGQPGPRRQPRPMPPQMGQGLAPMSPMPPMGQRRSVGPAMPMGRR